MSRSLSSERTRQIITLLEQAMGLDPDAQKAFLDELCADNPKICNEVKALLEADARAELSAGLDDVLRTLFRSLADGPKLEPGQIISHYQILEHISSGGMGDVYKALDQRLDRYIALKFLPAHLRAHEEVKQRFILEAKAASGLDHPNICTIYDIGEIEPHQLYIAMAYYDGETLRTKNQRGQLPVSEALDYTRQIAEGLARAHASGIIHRDIKPANVMVTAYGRVKLLDFGIAKIQGAQITKTGSTIGTVAYMSPEQAEGKDVDARTDLWSLGVVLYEMLAGVRPFRGERDQATIFSILNRDPDPLPDIRPEVPEKLSQLVTKLLRKDPNERFNSADEVLRALKLAAVHPPTKDVSDQRRLAAIMFTDMVGYSTLTQKNESLAINLLEEHRQVLRPLFGKYSGREIETIGDAFFVEFTSALDAVRCGIAIQNALYTRNESLSEKEKIVIRIGVHLGDVVVREENVLGDGVNIAARLEPLAAPGGICISEDVARQVQNKIELPLRKLGNQQLKNIQLPMAAYAVELPWLDTTYIEENPVSNTPVIENEAKQVREQKSRFFQLSWKRSKTGVLRKVLLFGGIALLLILIATSGQILSRFQKQDETPYNRWTQLVRLTSQPGLEDEPNWSPDGRSLAYTSDEGGYLSIWIRQVDGERALRIGREGVDEAQPAWSPDGGQIAFISSRDHGGRLGIFLGSRPIESHVYGQNGDLYVMPALGGTARKLANDAYDPSWSPDGSKIAFRSIIDGNWRIYTVSVEDGKIELVKGVEPRVIGLSWSPDGRWIAYVAGASAATGWDLYAIPAVGGTPIQLTHDSSSVALRPSWSHDSRWIIFPSNEGGALNLRYMQFQPDLAEIEQPQQRLTTGSGEDVNPDVSPDGSSFAYATVHTSPDIWYVGFEDSSLTRLTSETTIEDYPRLSPDGTRVLFFSDRTGQRQVWMMDLNTGEKTQLSRDGGAQNAWSPDSRKVAYGTPQGLRILDLASGKEIVVATHLSTAYPSFSPDGSEICFQGRDEHQYRLYSVPAEGGDATIVPTPEGEPGNPNWSSDGNTIFYQLDQFGYRNIWAVDLASGESRQISTGNTDDAHPDVSPDGRQIMFLRNHRDLYLMPVEGGALKLVYAFEKHNQLIEFPAWSPDGKGIVLSVAEKTGDIFLLKARN